MIMSTFRIHKEDNLVMYQRFLSLILELQQLLTPGPTQPGAQIFLNKEDTAIEKPCHHAVSNPVNQ